MEIALKFQALREVTPAQWLERVNRHGPGVTTALLVIVLAWLAARLVLSMLPMQPGFDWSQPAVSSMPAASAGTLRPVDDRAIANARLFGDPGAVPAPVMVVDAPETRLNLRLRGSIAATDQNLAHAIIAEGNSRDRVYFIDDTVPGGATLHEVHVDRVILKRGGTLETLRLPQKSVALGTAAAAPLPVSSQLDPMSGMPDLRGSDELAAASFTDLVRPQPYMPGGELRGYRVYPGRNRRGFAALGLRPGDLVTDINGQPLTNLQEGLEIFRNLESSPQITVTIERNGSPMTLNLDSSQLNNAAGALQ